jgi:hypothetical protein
VEQSVEPFAAVLPLSPQVHKIMVDRFYRTAYSTWPLA